MPERIQLRRTKGWRKPEGAVVVARPSRWGNPFKVGECYTPQDSLWPWLRTPMQPADLLTGMTAVFLTGPQVAVDLYAWWLLEQPDLMVSLRDLAGRDLCCWCPADQPCHGDVLLDLANRGRGGDGEGR